MVFGQADGLAGGWGLELALLSGLPQGWQPCTSPGCCPCRSLSLPGPGSPLCLLEVAALRASQGEARVRYGLCKCTVVFPSTQGCVGMWRTISSTLRRPVSMAGSRSELSGCLLGTWIFPKGLWDGDTVMGMSDSDPCLAPLLWGFSPSQLHPCGVLHLPFCGAWCRGEEERALECLSLPQPNFSLQLCWQLLLGAQLKLLLPVSLLGEGTVFPSWLPCCFLCCWSRAS